VCTTASLAVHTKLQEATGMTWAAEGLMTFVNIHVMLNLPLLRESCSCSPLQTRTSSRPRSVRFRVVLVPFSSSNKHVSVRVPQPCPTLCQCPRTQNPVQAVFVCGAFQDKGWYLYVILQLIESLASPSSTKQDLGHCNLALAGAAAGPGHVGTCCPGSAASVT
jgi:hypothetical protein